MKLNLELPNPNEAQDSNKIIEKVLLEVKTTVENKYEDKILVLITTSSTYNNDKQIVLSYAVYLSFVNKNKFSYRLFELNCLNSDGGLPVEVNAFSGPSVTFGEANTQDDLEKVVEKIFAEPRTRNIILSNYKL